MEMSYPTYRHKSRLVCLLAALLSLSAVVSAQNLNGSWTGWMESNDFFGAIRIDLQPAGSTVTLYYAGDQRSGAIEGLKVNGSEIAFEGKLQPSGRFKGTIDHDRIGGTVEILNRSGAITSTASWSVRRIYTPIASLPTAASSVSQIGLPKPTGAMLIGRRLFFWTDESRGEELTDDPNDHRRIFVQLWYPAIKGTGSDAASYFPTQVAAAYEPNSIPDLHLTALSDARIAKGRFPLIIFSPGLGTDPLRYASIIEELVSHGYVVAAINHPYDSGSVMWPDGKKIQPAKKWDSEAPKDWSADERKAFMDSRRIGWARDASFVVDQVKSLDIARSIDIDQLGMLGHSFGGQAASIVCASDHRFKTCANLDGLAQGNAVLPAADGTTMTQPFLFFTKVPAVTDSELQLMGIDRSEYLEREHKRLVERWNPSFKKQIAAIPSGGYLIVYPGITHMTFSDAPLTDEHATEPLKTRLERIELINKYILAFFDQELRGKRSPLLNSPTGASGLLIEFLKK